MCRRVCWRQRGLNWLCEKEVRGDREAIDIIGAILLTLSTGKFRNLFTETAWPDVRRSAAVAAIFLFAGSAFVSQATRAGPRPSFALWIQRDRATHERCGSNRPRGTDRDRRHDADVCAT